MKFARFIVAHFALFVCIGFVSFAKAQDDSGASLTVAGSGDGTVTLSSSNNYTDTSGVSSGSLEVDGGSITGGIAGTSTVTKLGTTDSIWNIGGGNTFTGGVTVTGGVSVAGGSSSTSTAVWEGQGSTSSSVVDTGGFEAVGGTLTIGNADDGGDEGGTLTILNPVFSDNGTSSLVMSGGLGSVAPHLEAYAGTPISFSSNLNLTGNLSIAGSYFPNELPLLTSNDVSGFNPFKNVTIIQSSTVVFNFSGSSMLTYASSPEGIFGAMQLNTSVLGDGSVSPMGPPVYSGDSFTDDFVTVAAPEPSNWALTAMGLVALTLLARTRRTSASR